MHHNAPFTAAGFSTIMSNPMCVLWAAVLATVRSRGTHAWLIATQAVDPSVHSLRDDDPASQYNLATQAEWRESSSSTK
jgi:hypothetical protein